MAIKMAQPTKRCDSANYQFKMRVPAGLRHLRDERLSIELPGTQGAAAIVVRPKVGQEFIKLSLLTADRSLAKIRCAAANERISNLARAHEHGPVFLTTRQQAEISGELHAELLKDFADDAPGFGVMKVFANYHRALAVGENPTGSEALAHETRERLGAAIGRRGLVAHPQSFEQSLRMVHQALAEACAVIEKMSVGDYTRNPYADRYPNVPPIDDEPERSPLSLREIWEAWVATAAVKPKTIKSYATNWRRLEAYLADKDAALVTTDDIQEFIKHVRTTYDVGERTLNDSVLAALKSIFKFAVKEFKLPLNPAKDVDRTPFKKKEMGMYSPEGAEAIVRWGLEYRASSKRELPGTSAFMKWAPIIYHFTGARASEIGQLRQEDVQQIETLQDGKRWFIQITPKAGSVKSDKPRWLPVHQQIVDLGFIKFVQSCKLGYLFVRASTPEEAVRKADKLAGRLRDKLPKNLREDGVAPLHGFRHHFITMAVEYQIDGEMRDKITGHCSPKVSVNAYMKDALGRLWREMNKQPHVPLHSELNAPATH